MWQWWYSAARTAASPKVTPKRPFHYWIIRRSTETALRNWPTGASRTRHPATTSFHVHLPPLALLHQPFPHATTIWGGLQVALALLNQFQQSGSEGQRAGSPELLKHSQRPQIQVQIQVQPAGARKRPLYSSSSSTLFYSFPSSKPSLHCPLLVFTAASSMRILRSSQRLFQSKTRDQRRQQDLTKLGSLGRSLPRPRKNKRNKSYGHTSV